MKFYVTFGSQYATIPHPTIPRIHPDGILELEAENQGDARAVIVALIGTAWSNLYTAPEMGPDWNYYPRGVTHRIERGVIREV